MTLVRYLTRSLSHYRFAYLGVLAGAILGATVLLGALFAGDSVKASLRRIGEQRIGRTTHVLSSGDRFFRAALAADLAAGVPPSRAAPVVLARGTATHAGTRASANQVQLAGVTEAFWSFAPEPHKIALSTNAAEPGAAINETLARRLNLAVGDTLVVRLQKPGVIAGNAPIAGAEAALQSQRCRVEAIVGDAAFGRFSLEATQVSPASIFLPLGVMQTLLAQPDRANLVLLETTQPAAAVQTALTRVVQLADYGLELKWLERAATFELTSPRIFIDPALAEAAVKAVPAAQPVTSYLVNEFRLRERATPYSIATATTPATAPFLPADFGAREVVLNRWLADDLGAAVGDEVRLAFYQLGRGGELVENTDTFRVRAIVPLDGLAADRAWMPAFPGISDVANQSDWNPGLPLDLARIRTQDEKYWDDYRGAPKAFLSAEAGRRIWSTRWGNTTALRIAQPRENEAALTRTLLSALRPEMNQLLLRPVRETAQAAANPSVDFAGLFLGMSFFLILAALGLVAMLFQLALLQRQREDALLGAIGLPGGQVLRWRLGEALAILLVGCALGLPLAMLYTHGILRFLATIWGGEGGGFAFVATPTSIGIGASIFVLLSLGAIWLAIRKQARRALSVRLAAHAEEAAPPPRARRNSWLLFAGALVAAAGALAVSGRGLPAQIAFYLAGFALLVGGIAACRGWLLRTTTRAGAAPLDAAYLGGLNLRARRARSLTVVGMIAAAVFMVLSVSSFRKHVGADWLERGSGTGGFALWIETTAPINGARDGKSTGFEVFERHAAELGEIVPLREGAGDNVNCFNLNTTAQPRLLAVSGAALATRGAFRTKGAGATAAAAWQRVGQRDADGAIPGLVDETTLMWALKRKIGDVLTYADETGRPFSVKIVGTLSDSLFQGYVVVDEKLFLEKFPSSPGYTAFLADAKQAAGADALRDRVGTSLADFGGRVELTRDVLAAFHAIENTYIAIFNVLGSLGVVLGSLGLAIVVARNLRERRGEFAVMSAIGLPAGVMARMVFAEYGRLVLWGIAIGGLASAIAVWPNLATLPAAPALALVGALLTGIVALNLACGWLVFRWSLRELRPSVALAAS